MTRNDEFIEKRLGGEDAVWNQLKYDRDGIIEASAGTGKTYALQSIVLKLVSDKDHPVDVKNILLVTYTEKAAGELKDRIRDVLSQAGCLPADFDETTICTIHSFCREILSEYAFENRIPMRMEIGGQNGDLVHRAVRAALLGDEFRARYGGQLYDAVMKAAEKEKIKPFEKRKIKTTDDLVSAAESILRDAAASGIPPDEPARTDDPAAEGQGDVAKYQLQKDLAYIAWPVFQRLKEDSAMFTFDDLVTQAYLVIGDEARREAKGRRSALLDAIRRRYRIALVDEFQDTDDKQWTIFGKLFSSRVNRLDAADAPAPAQGFLLVVGDPKQAIYGFRGAKVATYLAAKREISEGAGAQPPLALDATFRSSKPLVAAFDSMFGAESGWFGGMEEDGAKIEYSGVSYPEGNERFLGLVDLTGRQAVTLLESLPRRLPDEVTGTTGYGNSGTCLPVFMKNAALEMKRLCALPVAYRTRDPKTGEMVDHRIRYGDMCVLVRRSSEADIAKRVLAEHGIPYSHYKERGIYKSAEAEALIAFFDFLDAPGRAGNLAALLLTSLFDVHPSELEACLADGAFAGLAEKWQELSRKRSWSLLFESVMNDTELAHPVAGDYEFDPRWTAYRQILDRLFAEKGRSAMTPGEFAGLLRTWRKADRRSGEDGSLRQKDNESDSVQIMTMHASKGLEFKGVFVAAGFSEYKTDSPAELKRLFYVALTRAEHKLYLPWTKWDVHTRVSKAKGKPKKAEEVGLGSKGSPLLGNGFLSRAVRTCFARAGESVVSLSDADARDIPPPDVARKESAQAEGRVLPRIYEVGQLNHLRLQWDSFTTLSMHGASNKVEPSDVGEADESPADGDVAQRTRRTLLPRTNISGNVFHEIMETLCGADEAACGVGFAIGKAPLDEACADSGRLMDLVRRAMRRNALGNQIEAGDSTERTLARMVWHALNTCIEIGGRKLFLKDVPFADRLAEVEFVMDEASVFGADAPRLGGQARDGAFNGKIDLLVRPDGRGGPVYLLDWKTNSLADYEAPTVEAAIEAAGYPLQFKLYSLAVARWLGRESLAGVAYLFVRGGERGNACGVYARAMDDKMFADCRQSVLAALSDGR